MTDRNTRLGSPPVPPGDPHALLAALSPNPPFFTLQLSLRPEPKDRPRFGSTHPLTTVRTNAYEDTLRLYATLAAARSPTLLSPRRCQLAAVLALSGAQHQCDADNLAKAILDALQGIVYRNDRQVRRLAVILEKGEPDIRILIAEL